MKYLIKPKRNLYVLSGCEGRCSGNCIAKCGSLGSCFCPFDR